MKRKKVYKIGLSLFVAALFIFSAASSMATSINVEKGEAGDEREIKNYEPINQRKYEKIKIGNSNGVTSLQPDYSVAITDLYAGDYTLELGEENLIPSGTYPLTVELMNDGGGPALVKAFAEVYKKGCGDEVLLYETSFEDNFDIYNNWMQIDRDCGMDPDGNTGFFDTWTWTDARAYCGDHSFKNSMYDIYKGNQDDYLQCTKSFDVRDQYGTKVNFKIWVDGSQEEVYAFGPGQGVYSVFDYLDFEVGDQNGNWVNPYNVNSLTENTDQMIFLGPDLAGIPGGYNFADTTLPVHTYSPYTNYDPKVVDLGGGWWDVTFDVPNSYLQHDLGLDLSDIMFRFSWHSDPQFQFEGAYVDCFEVISLESVEEKIFQTHSQGPFEVEPCDTVEGATAFEFPLDWDAEFFDECGRKETCYDIVVWLEVLDENHWTPHDYIPPTWWESEGNDPEMYPGPQDYEVCVGDYFDLCVENLEVETSFGGRLVPPEGVMYEGEDAHIMADIHVEGTLPAEDITISAYAEEKQWEEIFFTDGESMMPWGEKYGFVHNTDRFAWSGDKSIGFFDEVENEYPNNGFSYILGPTVDFSEYEDVVMDFYTLFATETGIDYAIPCLLDPYAGFVLGISPVLTGWSDEEWFGPMQPRSWYQSVDLVGGYEYFVDSGFLRTPSNEILDEVQVGFYFTSDGSVNHHPNLDPGWSGVCLDDISIRGLKIGDKVWEDQIIIPGPCEPSETCPVQFEWEDVPFSNYRITVEDITQGSCDNYDCGKQSQQILVITDLERAHPKEVDSTDLTGTSGGPWGKCGSDYDNYLSSNPDSLFYPTNADYAATLCPDGEPCIDVSGIEFLDETDTIIDEDFTDAYPADWTAPGDEFFWHPGNEAGGDDPGQADCNAGSLVGRSAVTLTPTFDLSMYDTASLSFVYATEHLGGTYYIRVDSYNGAWSTEWSETITDDVSAGTSASITVPTTATQLRYVIYGVDNPGELNYFVFDDVLLTATDFKDNLLMNFDAWWDLELLESDHVDIQVANCVFEEGECCGEDGYCCPDELTAWTTIAQFFGTSQGPQDDDGWIPISIDLSTAFSPSNPPSDHICVRFVLHSGAIGARGMLIDDLELVSPSGTIFGPDTMDTMDNWCFDVVHYGQYWYYDDVDCCGMDGGWFNNVPAFPVNDALVWSTEISDSYEAYLSVLGSYNFAGSTMAYVEISDDGGDNWFILAEYTGSSGGCFTDDFILNYWVGKPVLIRVRVKGGDNPLGGYIEICDLAITGKEDNTAPTTEIEMSGTLKPTGWYASAVKVTITAEDTGSGVKEIHVVLDGEETVYPGNTATFTVSGDGFHDITYWAVDNVGNIGEKKTVPTFKIDAGAAPSVEITGPEPGLYLFGKKLLNIDKVFIVGAFDIVANAEDEDSGIYKVSFYLDDELLGELTEGDGATYSFYVSERHMGAGTIKVVAEDFAQNVAEDTLDIKYYKFF